MTFCNKIHELVTRKIADEISSIKYYYQEDSLQMILYNATWKSNFQLDNIVFAIFTPIVLKLIVVSVYQVLPRRLPTLQSPGLPQLVECLPSTRRLISPGENIFNSKISYFV